MAMLSSFSLLQASWHYIIEAHFTERGRNPALQESTRNDSELVQRALEGNLEAFDAIVRRYQDAVYATAPGYR